MTPPPVSVARVELAEPLTPREWVRIERLLDDWKKEVLAAARKHPARSYKLGVAQCKAFAKLLDGVPGALPAQAMLGGAGPSMKAAEAWMRTFTLRELDDALNVYIGRIKDALLYGLRHQVNPTQVAAWFYNATKDARVNWQLIARTEMVRANAIGRLHACRDMGFEQVWVPPHIGSCKSCKRLIENQVFKIEDLLESSNYGRPEAEWVPCCPLHPRCRHSYLPYVAEIYEDAMEHYHGLEAAGLTSEDRIDELFDSSGQLREGVTLDQGERDAIAWKSADPWHESLVGAVMPYLQGDRADVNKVAKAHGRERLAILELLPALNQRPVDGDKVLAFWQRLKAGAELPPIEVTRWPDGRTWIDDGQHRAWARRMNGEESIDAHVTEIADTWTPLEETAVREVLGKVHDPRSLDHESWVEKEPTSLAGVLLNPPQADGDVAVDYDFTGNAAVALDRLLFDGPRLRGDVGLALEQWWQQIAGDDWQRWSRLLLPAHERVPVVVVDYDQARRSRPEYSQFSDADLHFALVSAVAARRQGAEIAPGLPLDLRVIPTHSPSMDDLAAHAPAWDLGSSTWWPLAPEGVPDLDAAKTLGDYTWTDDDAVEPEKEDQGPLAFRRLSLDVIDRLLTEDELVAKARQQARIPGGDSRRGRIHPGEWTSDRSISAASESFDENALGYLVESRTRTRNSEHGEKVEKVAAILGDQLQLHDIKGGWRAGPRSKLGKATRDMIHALGHIPEEHAHALRSRGTRIELFDVSCGRACKIVAPADYTAGREAWGIFVPARDGAPERVVVGASEVAAETILHEVGHALTLDRIDDLAYGDFKAYDKLIAASQDPGMPEAVREHLTLYDEEQIATEAAAEAYVAYTTDPEGWRRDWPKRYRTLFEKLLASELENVAKTERLQPWLNGTVDGAPAHIDFGPITSEDVGKAVEPNAGVEHWITVHPHGDDDKGQPVLVRNNSDGTMSVIGGAGGSMNYMRLDPKRRISKDESKAQDKTAGEKAAAGAGGPEQTVTEEERAAQEQEFKAAQQQAQRTLEKADAQVKSITDQLRAFVETGIGAKWLTHGLIRHADGSEEEYELGFMERNQAMRKLLAGALQTLAVGPTGDRDAQDSPYLFTERQGDFEDMPEPSSESDERPEESEEASADDEAAREENATPDPEEAQRKINTKLPPLDEDQAQQVMQFEREIARWRRIKAKARKVLAGGKASSSAYAMEWTPSDVKDDVRQRVEGEMRTIAARDLLGAAEGNTFKRTYENAFHRGANDALDSFTHAVLGRSALSPEATALLGPMGSAQLIARVIQERATAIGDPDKLSLEHVRGAVQDLKRRMEGEIATRANARARLAMDTAVAMSQERKASMAGESLWTTTAAASYRDEKYREAANQLGMAISGLQAVSSLEVALEKPPATINVGGGTTPSELQGLAARAKIKLKADQITKTGRGGYSAEIPAEALTHLFDLERPPDYEHRERLKAIRTGKGLSKQIEQHRDTPGMSQRLGPAQAQGKMFLLATQKPNTKRHWNLTGTPIEKKSEDLRAQMSLGDTLDFAPGVGKTHTGIAAAMQLMHDEPHMNHRVLVTCPATALGTWAGTVMNQGPEHTAQIYGMETTHIGDGRVETTGKGGGGYRKNQVANPADFTVISHEQLARNPNIARDMGCTIVIADEAQKFKNTGNQRSRGLAQIGDSIGVTRGETPSRSAWQTRYGKLELGEEHITREDRISQFRQSVLDEHLFHMDAATAGNDLPDRAEGNANPFDGENDDRGYIHHEVKLDDAHRAAVQAKVQWVNEEQARLKANGQGGLQFGGAPIISKAVLDRPGNAYAVTAASQMAKSLKGQIDFAGFKDHEKHPDGAHAGSYAKKGVIFNDGVQELRHLVPELEKQGVKVFKTIGPKADKSGWESVDHETNERVQKAYLAHKGPCVMVTTDRNSTARSWQFGDNNGRFQHGGTVMMHYSLPDKGGNATTAQREARIHRRGAQAPVEYHKLCATEIPTQRRQHDKLKRERKAQQMAGNAEQLVGGKQTLRQRLDKQGVAPANALQTKAERAAAHAATEGKPDERPN